MNDETQSEHMEHAFPRIPVDIEFLLEPGVRYGRKYQFSDSVQWFLENGDEADFETLAAVAERARLSGAYRRFNEWSDDVAETIERVVDERYPYTIHLSEQQRQEYLRSIPRDVPDNVRERLVRKTAETYDRSELANQRSELRGQLIIEANDKVHDMDVYFLFALMDACDISFES